MNKNANTLCYLTIAVLSCFTGRASAQHLHVVPHTTTHIDHIRHGNHYHNVPHTTTHYDSYWHNGPDYVPHTTTHLDRVRHGNHYDLVPHTTTHFDAVYPNAYQSNFSGGYAGGYSAAYSGGYSGIVQSAPVYVNPPNIVSAPSQPPVIINAVTPQPTVALAPAAPPTIALASSAIPSISSATTVNKIPVPSSVPAAPMRIAKLTNPPGTQGSVAYMLNSFSYTIKPGESQTISLDRDWNVKFSNGLGKEVSYKLTEGKFEFTVSAEHGWDLQARKEPSNPPPPAPDDIVPSLPQNVIPTTAK